MRVKSYFSATVEAAIALASKELGEDALLVYSREAAAEARYLGKYEVVFALPEATESEAPPPLPGSAPTPGSQRSTDMESELASLAREIRALRDQMDQICQMNKKHQPIWRPTTLLHSPDSVRHAIETLLAEDIAEDLAAEVAERIASASHSDGNPTLEYVLASMVPTAPSLGRSAAGPKVVALVGPPGSGKTTTLVKLAARFGLGGRRPAQLISFDTSRISGADQLKTYAGILGISCESVETAGALSQVIEESRNKEIILIDTAGYSGKDMDTAGELVRFLATHPQVDVHLTLSASMKPADLSRAADRFERLRPNRLLFTHLDETETYGALWSEAVTRAKPVSFLCDGQQIPEDLHEATSEGLARLILRHQLSEPESGAAAAA